MEQQEPTPSDQKTNKQPIDKQIKLLQNTLNGITNHFYSEMLTIATSLDYIQTYFNEMLDYANQNNILLPEFKPSFSLPDLSDLTLRNGFGINNISPGYATFVGSESNLRFSVPIGYLQTYPDSVFYKYYYSNDHRDSNGCIQLDRSEETLPYCISILKGESIPMNSALSNDQYLKIKSDLIHYNLPVPKSLNDYCINIEQKEIIEKKRLLWRSNEINILVGSKVYTILRSNLNQRNIHHSFFDKHTHEVIYNVEKKAFELPDSYHYFDYINDYIQTGEIHLQSDDYKNYLSIKNEFERMGIYDENIWKSIRQIPLKNKMEKAWRNEVVQLNVENIIYSYRRSFLNTLNIPFFENDFKDLSLYNEMNNIFKIQGAFQYYCYIDEYLRTGKVHIRENHQSIDCIHKIKDEFERFMIEKPDLWSSFLNYHSLTFPDSYILNDEYADIVSTWVGSDKRWKLAYRYFLCIYTLFE